MMAEMVAGEKKEDVTSSSDEDDDVGGDIGAGMKFAFDHSILSFYLS